MKSVQVLLKEISFKSQMDVWWQRTGSALAIVGGIGATYGAWFELPSIKSDNKDFKEDFKNQTMEFNKRFEASVQEFNKRFDASVQEYNRRFDTSITLGVTVPIAVSLALGFICLSFRK
jgi:hypothetical protein